MHIHALINEIKMTQSPGHLLYSRSEAKVTKIVTYKFIHRLAIKIEVYNYSIFYYISIIRLYTVNYAQ